MNPLALGPLQQISDQIAIETLGRLILHARVEKALGNRSEAELEAYIAETLLAVLMRHDQRSVSEALASTCLGP